MLRSILVPASVLLSLLAACGGGAQESDSPSKPRGTRSQDPSSPSSDTADPAASSANNASSGETTTPTSPPASSAALAASPIFAEGLAADWLERSSARVDDRQGAVVHAGQRALAVELDRRQALRLESKTAIDATAFDSLRLWVHGGTEGGQRVRLAALAGDQISAGVELGSLVPGGSIPAGTWTEVTVSFAALGVRGAGVTGIWLGDLSGNDQGTLYLDDVAAVAAGAAAPPAAAAASAAAAPAPGVVSIDPQADRRPVSPFVYGASFGSAAQLQRQRFPARRWGGNHTSRYNWKLDVTNRASDWYFLNVAEETPDPSRLPEGSAADTFVGEALGAGAEPLITVPMIGWVAKDRELRSGFSVKKYGAQSGALGDAGNGIKNGKHIQGNDPADTSAPSDPEFVAGWLGHLGGRFGDASHGGVRFYALDNELTLWPETHRDVHPQEVTYDEIWQRTREYASRMKAQDPGIELFGPVAWGWCAYFSSSADCLDGPDRQAHGGLPILQWYMDQNCAYEREHGVRLVDYLTIHYYPQGGVYSQNDSADLSTRRLASLKSLYDPTFHDGSWIPEPVNLVPRMKSWIAEHCPGMQLAITEYSFGSDNTLSGALAQAEAMAIFGREGVDLATRWTAPDDGERIEDAFALFRDYDGQGASVMGDSVRATSFSVDAVGSYAVRDGQKLYVLLFNKSTAAQELRVDVAGGVTGGAQVFGFDGAARLGPRGQTAAEGGGFQVSLPARSATLVVTQMSSSTI